MTTLEPVAEIAVLIYPGAQLGAVHGMTDLLSVANLMAQRRYGENAPALRFSQWRPGEDGQRLERVLDSHPGRAGEPDFIVLPPAVVAPITAEDAAPLALWLRRKHDAGATLASVCAGAFLLGETGLLENRSATTHWFYANDFAERFPSARMEIDKLVIDDGDLITAGGIMAWTDLGLKLVDRLMGPTTMLDTARFLLVDPPGREQRHYSVFSPKLRHGDEAILRVQHWLQATGAREATLAAMSDKAGLEPRTFLRRFRKATGLKPTEYCQHLRVGKARETLEATTRSVEQIAWDVGYEDPGAFRKIFIKVTGLSPRDYRHRFGLARLHGAAEPADA
ncbi:GlxA family transcriptional regulator [Hansschlegelia beijingensis]|uniref:Transcriptional regulator GlxA family with amidase domain n=1 Tax=Hansschlegelia beijingensis TaxID=1133344 RepID=A0A7W6D4Q6_9HYPH|nr:GlxA family transcriptional regulator [Hansschlegelia beijingensis]MBB3974097.1 transcriptional regulator GlxA family with amidase domain [Hansschlegelia beijingensis]